MKEYMYRANIDESWKGMSIYTDTFLEGIIVLASSKESAREKVKQIIKTFPTHTEETFWDGSGKPKKEIVLVHRKIESIEKVENNVFMDYYTGTG